MSIDPNLAILLAAALGGLVALGATALSNRNQARLQRRAEEASWRERSAPTIAEVQKLLGDISVNALLLDPSKRDSLDDEVSRLRLSIATLRVAHPRPRVRVLLEQLAVVFTHAWISARLFLIEAETGGEDTKEIRELAEREHKNARQFVEKLIEALHSE